MTRRIVVLGGPRTGKTTYAATLGGRVRHTDDAMDLGWSEASAEVARWMVQDGPWVIEGVAGARALRKALATSTERPCDRVVVLSDPWAELTSGQRTMTKGCVAVFAEIRAELLARGVEVETRKR